jgi:acetyl-CoA synthetase (ADP-forming)
MLGTGGIFVEVLKDISFRVAPISENDALEMISEIKGNTLLKGVRGKKPSDIKSLVSMLLKTSKLAMSDESIMEIDMNPVFVSSSGAMAADARVVLDK